MKIKPSRDDEFAEFFPMKKASVIVYERDSEGNNWFNNLILRQTKCNCGCNQECIEYEAPVFKFPSYKEAVIDAMNNREIKTTGVCKSVWKYPFRETGLYLIREKYAEILGITSKR